MELTTKLLEQIAFHTRLEIEEHMLIIMAKSTHGEHLYQPLQTNNKQFQLAITFLSGQNGIFNVKNLNIKFFFKKTFDDGEFIQISRPQGAYEIESLNNEIKRFIIDEGYYTENNYPFTIKPIFSTLGSFIEISQTGPIISFVMEDSIGILLGFDETILYNEYNLSPNHVDILSFDDIFIESNLSRGMIFRGRRSGFIHNCTMDFDPGYKYIERFRGGIQWYMMDSKDIFSSINFRIKNENNHLVSFNSQSVTFRLSIKEI